MSGKPLHIAMSMLSQKRRSSPTLQMLCVSAALAKSGAQREFAELISPISLKIAIMYDI